ncbi:MAG: GPR endopeptidase [Clostridia bacterium]|nr:GPR endopeptidase [Clostridia bacterium]
MYKARTDLAVEECERFSSLPVGVTQKVMDVGKARIIRVTVDSEEAGKILGKPKGRYITVETEPFSHLSDYDDGRQAAVSGEISKLLPKEGTVLIAGLGNTDITPDAFGVKVAEKILATRHLDGELMQTLGLGDLRSVASVATGVLGKTGIETCEMLKGIVERINPCAVIAVDALAAKSLSRLGKTVQISDAGIIPGSGVGNARQELSRASLGVPVIAVGVPTVVDGVTIVHDLIEDADQSIEEKISPKGRQMMVTPREVDVVVENAANLVALSINRALHPHIKMEEMLTLTL